MDAERKHIADKILKLLALASSTTFAAERESAQRMAEQLITKHNVDVKASAAGKPAQDSIEVRNYEPFARGARWEGIIASALGDLTGCNVYFNRETLDRYVTVGAIWNLDVLSYLLREVNRQRMAAWLGYKGKGGADSFHKFCYGFATALRDKIKMIVEPQRLETNRKQLGRWYETNVLHRKVETVQLGIGAARSAAGKRAGADASLHRGALGRPQRLIR